MKGRSEPKRPARAAADPVPTPGLEALGERVLKLEKALDETRAADQAKDRLLTLLGRVTAGRTVDDICRATVEGVRELLGFERAGLFLWDERIRTFRGTYGTDMNLQTTDEHHYLIQILPGSPEERILAGSIVERRCKLGSPDAMPGEEAVKADLVGLRLDGRLYGILSVDNRLTRRAISDRELEHLLLLSQVLGNALEISRARLALAQSEERFRQVSENSGEWIWELNEDGRYTYSSPVVRAILGVGPDDVMGRRLVEHVVEEERSHVATELNRAYTDKTPVVRLINRQVHQNGQEIMLETTAIPILDAGGRCVGLRGAHRDVTRERELEAQLRHSQKIDAIGRLAGGIAHDFNNLLTAILGCGSLLLEEVREDDPVRADIERIRTAGERAAALTRQLLAFSRRQVLHVEPVNINNIVLEMEKILQRTIGEDIELVTRLDANAPVIETDADQLQQIILHLAINARDAMADPRFVARTTMVQEEIQRLREKVLSRPKRLSIETASVDLDEAFCGKHVGVKPGLHVMLSVTDTGIGMPKDVQEHLFEPFFTTREVGQGSGLGLSTVYGIVRQMGGLIQVESVLGEGTTFRIYLPLAAVEARRAAPPATTAAPRGKETILVVEDEEIVRNLTARMLQTLGYEVLQAANGREGLEVCRAQRGPIDLILTDLVMPQMSGRQFVTELRKLRQDFKALFVSGYSSADTVDGMVVGTDTPLIQKPFTREVLARKIREVLEKA